jgi:hypothetical protein
VKLGDTETKVTRSSNLCHCEQAGMDGYMLKPPTRTKLRTLLTQYLAARQSVGGARVKGGLMTQVNPSRVHWRRSAQCVGSMSHWAGV